MGTRKEALGKTTGALKELISTLVGWPWIKRKPKQLNMFDRDYAEYVRTNEQRFSAWRQVMNDVSKKVAHAQDGIAEVRHTLLSHFQAETAHLLERIEALEATVADTRKRVLSKDSDRFAELREKRKDSPNNSRTRKEKKIMVAAPLGMGTHHFLWGMKNHTKQDIADYANWARDTKEFAPNAHRGSGPIKKWSDGKRSIMFGHMLDLKLVKVIAAGSGKGPKKAVFVGTMKTWKYTPSTIEKLSIRLFEQGVGKWVPQGIPTDTARPTDEELVDRAVEDELSQEELVQQAYDLRVDNPEEAEALYERAIELDNQANGVVTVLEEYKDEGAEQKNYHVGTTKTDLGDDWSAKYRDDRRGNREHS